LTVNGGKVKNKTKANVVVVSFFIALGSVILVAMAFSSATTMPGPVMQESLYPQVQGVSQNSGYCNVSLSILNTSPSSVTLDKIQMHGTSVATFINGTEIIDPSQMSYGLKSGDPLQVNLIAPIANYTPNATVAIVVYTPQAMYYVEAMLP